MSGRSTRRHRLFPAAAGESPSLAERAARSLQGVSGENGDATDRYTLGVEGGTPLPNAS